MSDNLLKKELRGHGLVKSMKACVDAEEFHVDTLYGVLDKVHAVPSPTASADAHVGDVLGEEILFASIPCT